ncbi:MAG: ubiG 1 [Herminiimonas sp.]|nr:ubiG 1 [Herminiimonas sp.]
MKTMDAIGNHSQEVAHGDRFSFGQNWAHFLNVLNEERIKQAVDSLKARLEIDDLRNKAFLDIGSGSGLFSLAALRLGAKVHSFDYDPESVGCTKELKARYFCNDDNWKIEAGSVLDKAFLRSLGKFDVVYSWGVLHHTGDLWTALENITENVAPHGKLFISLYNDQGGASKRWHTVKKIYNRLPPYLKLSFAVLVCIPMELRSLAIHVVRREPQVYFRNIANYSKDRGMSWWHDKVDWIGGFPFEVSRPEQIFDFYKVRGYTLKILKTSGGLACNEFVFQRND